MDRFNVAVKVVQNAGNLLRQCHLEETEICQKTSHQDLVTRWDRRIEQLLRNEILTAFPQDAIVGEEYPPETHRAESITWYIDPIDGTTNFINQHQNYAISVGCWEGSVPLFGLVLDVERKALYWGKHGGGAWQDQQKQFDNLPGCILMTTNCLMRPRESYKDRIYSTNVVGWEGVKYIGKKENGEKDFSL